MSPKKYAGDIRTDNRYSIVLPVNKKGLLNLLYVVIIFMTA